VNLNHSSPALSYEEPPPQRPSNSKSRTVVLSLPILPKILTEVRYLRHISLKTLGSYLEAVVWRDWLNVVRHGSNGGSLRNGSDDDHKVDRFAHPAPDHRPSESTEAIAIATTVLDPQVVLQPLNHPISQSPVDTHDAIYHVIPSVTEDPASPAPAPPTPSTRANLIVILTSVQLVVTVLFVSGFFVTRIITKMRSSTRRRMSVIVARSMVRVVDEERLIQGKNGDDRDTNGNYPQMDIAVGKKGYAPIGEVNSLSTSDKRPSFPR